MLFAQLYGIFQAWKISIFMLLCLIRGIISEYITLPPKQGTQESIPMNRFLDSLKVSKFGLGMTNMKLRKFIIKREELQFIPSIRMDW
jgi:hypothetical protein